MQIIHWRPGRRRKRYLGRSGDVGVRHCCFIYTSFPERRTTRASVFLFIPIVL